MVELANEIVSAGRRRRQDTSQDSSSQQQTSESTLENRVNFSEEHVADNVTMRLRQ